MAHPPQESLQFSDEDRAAYMQQVAELTVDYWPNPDVAQFAGGIGVTALMGPTGSGKSTLFELSNLQVVLGITSRSPRLALGERDGVGFRRFLNLNQAADRAEILAKLSGREYVQAASPAANGNFYGSEPIDYPTPNMGINTLTREYYRLAGANPFGRLTGVFMVPESFDEWQTRWLSRSAGLPADHQARMREARDSLELAVGDQDLYFLLNADGQQESTAKLLRDIAEGYQLPLEDQEQARNAAAGILHELIVRA